MTVGVVGGKCVPGVPVVYLPVVCVVEVVVYFLVVVV